MVVQVKICGLTRPDTMAAALEAGADYVGLVFFGPSPRNVNLPQAIALAEPARGRARVVALVVDAPPDRLVEIARELEPDVIQLHGHETPDDVARLRDHLAEAGVLTCELWKALPIAGPDDLAAVAGYRAVVERLLFDAKPPKGAALPGGNGQAFDWTLLDPVKGRFPFLLSGGLTPETVAGAILATQAAAVDVSSGVETAPGVKDAALIWRFVTAAKACKPH